MKCDFYGEVAIPPRRYKVRAQCPKCKVIRTLQRRVDGWYFPAHNEPRNTSTLQIGEWEFRGDKWQRVRPVDQVREHLGSACQGLEILLEKCPPDDSRLYGLLQYAYQAIDHAQNSMDMVSEHLKE